MEAQACWRCELDLPSLLSAEDLLECVITSGDGFGGLVYCYGSKQKLDRSGRSRLHQAELQHELGAKSAMEPGGGQCDLDTELSRSLVSLGIMLTK